MIVATHLSRRFGPLLAVDDLSFQIEAGEVVGFLGPNGAGKTTTLRILAGFLPATSGSASVAGFDVLRQSMEVRKRIGYLAESVPLYGEHRVEEMLDFQGRLHGMSRADRRRRVPEVLERVGVLDRRRQLVGHLSRGLRQRVGLATALLPDPEVLILDEPTSGLDPLQRIEVRRLIADLAGEHTLIVSSHILPEIEAVCPRVLILSRGRLAADGSREELVRTLGGGSRVRVELASGAARGGPGLPGAADRLRAIPGVERLRERDAVEGVLAFDLDCEVDLRPAVGELARREGWTLRELSWREATLEELFARIALELDEELPQESTEAAASPEADA